jgi:hypothetical protein
VYSNFYGSDPWDDLQAAQREDLQTDIAVETARVQRLERQITDLQSAQPKDLTAQLASELGEDVETVRAKVAAVKAAGSAPSAPNPDRLSELLDNVDPNDYEGAVRAFDQAGYTTIDAVGQSWQGGRMQRSGMPQGSTEEIYRFLDTATSLEDYEAKLRQVGLLEGGVA